MAKTKSEEKVVGTLLHNAGHIDRMKVGAHLINTFNFAILKQAGRGMWNEHDMQCFSVALGAIDQVGDGDAKNAHHTTNNVQVAEADVGDQLIEDINALARSEYGPHPLERKQLS